MNDSYDKLIDAQLERLTSVTPSNKSTERAIDAAKRAIQANSTVAKPTGIFKIPMIRLAIAAAIIVAICLTIMLVNSNNHSTNEKQIANPNNNGITAPGTNNNIDIDQQSLKAQLAELENMYATGNIEALIAKLNDDNPTIATAAAAHLAKTTDTRALQPLENLAAKWQGETENPFQKAIASIKSNIDKQADIPQETKSGEEPGITPTEPNNVDATSVKKKYEKPQNIYYTEEQVMADGASAKAHMWISLPDLYKQQNDESTVIDNGIERLTLNHKEKTAQFEESWHSVKPPSEHHYFQSAETFRKEIPDYVKVGKNTKESTVAMAVYDLSVTTTTQTGQERVGYFKAWVHIESMLVAKMERVNPDNDPNIGSFIRHTTTVKYSPIADSVFDMKVPPGYKVLGRKDLPTFSGQVIDAAGNPVAGAKVYMKASGMPHTVKGGQMDTYTETEGIFVFTLPPNSEGIWDRDPICVWATLEDDTDHIAWTLIRSEKAMINEKGRMALAGTIPPHHAKLEICERYAKGGPWLKGASGIILKMEESGTIFGNVKDSLGNPLANARVNVSFTIRNKLGHQTLYGQDLWQMVVSTDDQGNYIVDRLPKLWKNTAWGISASAGGYNSKTFSFESTGPLDKRQVDLELLLTGITVRGTLVDNYGKVLDDRYVFVKAGKGNARRTARTDAKGEFEVKDCPITDKLTVIAELSHNSYPPHFPDKFKNFVFYPEVSKEIVMEDDTFEYSVDLIAELPELTVEVEVVDSSGHPLLYFPVEIRSFKSNIPTEWTRAKLLRRTDKKGFCVIKDVPNLEDLYVVLYGNRTTQFDSEFDESTKKLVDDLRNEYSKMRITQLSVGVIEGQRKYKIQAVVLMEEEYQQIKRDRSSASSPN